MTAGVGMTAHVVIPSETRDLPHAFGMKKDKEKRAHKTVLRILNILWMKGVDFH